MEIVRPPGGTDPCWTAEVMKKGLLPNKVQAEFVEL